MKSEKKPNVKLNPKPSFYPTPLLKGIFFSLFKRKKCLFLQTLSYAFTGISQYMQIYLFYKYYCISVSKLHFSPNTSKDHNMWVHINLSYLTCSIIFQCMGETLISCNTIDRSVGCWESLGVVNSTKWMNVLNSEHKNSICKISF